MSLAKDDSRHAGLGGRSTVSGLASVSVADTEGTVHYLQNLSLCCSACGHASSLLFTSVKRAI